MMQTHTRPNASELDRLIELTSVGAGHAANALATLLGEPCAMRVPTARIQRAGEPATSLGPIFAGGAQGPVWGTFFELSGNPAGFVAWLIPPGARRYLVSRLLGRPGEEVGEREASSAVREAGNIVVSHMATAMADVCGGVVLPSVPTLAIHDAPFVLASLITLRTARGPLLRIETDVSSRSGRFRSAFCHLPEVGGPPASARP